jgi:hypothetical protein
MLQTCLPPTAPLRRPVSPDHRVPWTTLLRRRRDFWTMAQLTRRLYRSRVSPGAFAARVQERMKHRPEAFLDMLERTVFGVPASPYRPLFGAAGYDLDRVRTLVSEKGLEPALERLATDGVYVTIDEYKGRRPLTRGTTTLTLTDTAFGNPLVTSGLVATTGGTRSKGLPTLISMENIHLGAEHLRLAVEAYGLQRASVAVWLPFPHGASVWAVLAFGLGGMVPREWFAQLSTADDPAGYWDSRYRGLRAGAALAGVRVPRPRHIGVGDEGRIPEYLGHGDDPWVVFTTPSFAIRLALAAQRTGSRLGHVTFLTIGEPLTRAKVDTIAAVGARAFSSLGFTEFGRATYGCARPEGLDDGHVCLDAVAVIERSRVVDRFGSRLPALLFTALPDRARKILINMETGDYAKVSERRCGCSLDRLGWTLHLSEIRSFEKLNAEGMLFFGSQIITLIEEDLPARFGGDATDYQLIEREDTTGITRMSLRVHPRRGAIDEAEMLRFVGDTLVGHSEIHGRVWANNGTVTLERAEPIITRAGKSMPLHHLA